MTAEAQETKAKVNKWDYMKQVLLQSKESHQQNEKARYTMEENICQSYIIQNG